MIPIEKRHLFISLFRAKVLLKSEGSRTFLRYSWWLLDPLMDMCLFYVVFGLMMQRGGPDFVPCLLIGVIVARFFITATTLAPDLLIHNEHVLCSVYLPKYIFPLAHVTACAVKYSFLLLTLIFFLLLLGESITLFWIMILPVSILYVLFVLGFSMFLCGLAPFFPDGSQLYAKISMILYWGSGVFFKPEEIIPSGYLTIFYINPLASYIRAYRECLLYNTLSWPNLMFLAFISLLTLGLGYALLSRYDKQYPRIIAQE